MASQSSVLGLVLVLSWVSLVLADKPYLRVNSRGIFKIAAFSDLHYGENEDSFGIPQDSNSTKLIRHVLSAEIPDLVVLNGDLITGENTFASNSTKYIDRIVQPLVEGGYKWASTYGNHDSKYNLSRKAVLEEELKYPNAYTQRGPFKTDGVSNYMLPLYEYENTNTTTDSGSQLPLQPDTLDEKPIALLYFLDSRGGSQGDPGNGDNIPNFVSDDTAAWLNSTAYEAKQQWGILPSLAFVHIPIQAFWDLQQDAKANVSGAYFPGLNADVPLAQEGNGAVGKNCCTYAGQDIPFMQTLLEMEGLHSVFSGHDHGDSWCGLWPEKTDPSSPSLNTGENYASNGRPFLCFCKHSGFGGYGGWNRGVRQIQLGLDSQGLMHVESWVRMQWGEDHPQVVTRVSLNSTYGQDVYDTVDGGFHPY